MSYHHPQLIDKGSVRRICDEVWSAAILGFASCGMVGLAFYLNGRDSLCAAAIALAGVAAGIGIGAMLVQRKI